jgi:hypothetical protein
MEIRSPRGFPQRLRAVQLWCSLRTKIQFNGRINSDKARKRHQTRHLEFYTPQLLTEGFEPECNLDIPGSAHNGRWPGISVQLPSTSRGALRGTKDSFLSFQFLRRPGCTAKLLCYHIVSEFESRRLEVIDTRKMGNLRSLPKLSRSHRFQSPSGFQLRPSLRKLSAANSIAFRVLFKASQASDVGSIPIARSRF